MPVCDFLRGRFCHRSLRPCARLRHLPKNDRPVRLLCCHFFVIEAISGPKPGDESFLARRAWPAGLEPRARPLASHSGRRDAKTGDSTVSVCVQVGSFTVLYVCLIVFKDKKCTFFPCTRIILRMNVYVGIH